MVLADSSTQRIADDEWESAGSIHRKEGIISGDAAKLTSQSRSVAPMPNLLYSTVSPDLMVNFLTCVPVRPSPTAATSPMWAAAHGRVNETR